MVSRTPHSNLATNTQVNNIVNSQLFIATNEPNLTEQPNLT